MPLRHRPDFKQALSSLQRLQQEAGEEPQVPTYSYKHQQWEARSSSSTWWNWQGSWLTPYHSAEMHQVNGATCCSQYLAKFFRKRLS